MQPGDDLVAFACEFRESRLAIAARLEHACSNALMTTCGGLLSMLAWDW